MTGIMKQKKPKSLLGFEPGRLGQNAVARPIMPTPRLTQKLCSKELSEKNSTPFEKTSPIRCDAMEDIKDVGRTNWSLSEWAFDE